MKTHTSIYSNKFYLIRLLIFITSIFTIGVNCHAQRQSEITWTTDSESFPQNSVKAIAADKHGFIWMTTEKGLVRYDGTNFKVYDSQQLRLVNDRFVYLRGNPETDSLYTFTEYGEDIVLINQRKAERIDSVYHPETSLYDHAEQQSVHSFGTPTILALGKNPYRITLKSGNYYIIRNKTVTLFSKKDLRIFSIPFEYESNANFFAFDDVLFYLNQDGSYAAIQNGTISVGKLNAESNKNAILYWNIVSRQAFYYAKNKLHQLVYESGKLRLKLLLEGEDFIRHDVSSIYFAQHSGKLFLGSRKKGLGIYIFKPFRTVVPQKQQESNLSEVFYALHKFSDSTIISSNGIVMTDKTIKQYLNFTSDDYNIAVDKRGDIWVSNMTHLFRYRKNENYKLDEKWDFGNNISTIFVDSHGYIWLAVSKRRNQIGTLYQFNPQDKPVFRKIVETKFKINFLAQSADENLWIGSKKGLYKIVPKRRELIKVKGTENLRIRNLHISEGTNIWISTYEAGFYLYKNQKLYSFPKDRHNYLQSAHCFVEHNGFFWIPTNKGLFQVRKQNLLDYISKKSNVYYYFYGKESGFLTNEFNGGCQPCGIKLENGLVFLPSMNGVVTFNANTTQPDIPANDIFIDDAIVDDRPVAIAKNNIHLDRNFSRIIFLITSPYFGNAHNQNFEARLDGPKSQNWSDVSKENTVVFTNLIPGHYKLTVRKLNGFGTGYVYEKVSILIEPAFWQTSGFKVFMLFIIVAIVLISFNIRFRYVKNANSLLEKAVSEKTSDLKNTITTLRKTKDTLTQQIENNRKIIQYITHDIKSPLSYMTRVSKRVYEKFDENDEEAKDSLESIYTSSAQIYNFVSNLLEYSNVNFESKNLEVNEIALQKAIEEKKALFEGIARSQKTTIKNLVPEEITLKSNRQLFSIIIHNLLDNAIKHTHHGSIVFSVLSENGEVLLKISDTGNGFDPEILEYYQLISENYTASQTAKPKGMGLQIVLELLLILNGKIRFENNPNTGTTITLKFGKL